MTYLSPYISRGVISTKQVFHHIQSLELAWDQTEKLIQELAWRDYWQQVWIVKREAIKQDLKSVQERVSNVELPAAIVEATTTIEEVDEAIKQLYETGYMHNHMRMYVASICCNIAQSHWLEPAKWMYSHLLDGDLASNYLSWQWVAGTFSKKKYFANQKNINKFFGSQQQGSFLDVEYSAFENFSVPQELIKSIPFEEETQLPKKEELSLDKNKTTLVYNYYNIDPYWYQSEDVQRVFLMEPSFFKAYPVSQKCIDFVLGLLENIEGIKIYVGEFTELQAYVNTESLVYKEHPTNSHYQGREESREWISSIKGYYPSFFAFWKKSKKEIKR